MNKIERLMAIVLKLYKDKKVTAQQLAEAFEVNVRTIYRDIEALCEMNIPIISYCGNEGGYSLMEDYFIPPILFNRNEVLTLLLSKKIIDIVNIPGYSQYANSAFLKIQSNINKNIENEINNLNKRITFNIKCKSLPQEELNFFEIIKTCLEKNLKIKIQYFNPHKLEFTERIIHPYGMIFEDGVWYIPAFCEMKNQERLFRMDRIRDTLLVEENFSLPDNFDIENYCNEKWYLNSIKNKKVEIVKLKFTKEMYHIVKDYYYFKFGNVIEENNNYILSVITSNPEDYIQRAFNFFDGLEIIEPLWLREKFKEELKKLCTKYI